MTRTHDLLITNQLLYQLSYTSVCESPPEAAGFKHHISQRFWGLTASHSAGDLAAAQTTGACVGMPRGPVDEDLHALDVGLPCAVGTPVRMTHLDAEGNSLITKFTLCHLMLHLLA